jgi:hypothetical protein
MYDGIKLSAISFLEMLIAAYVFPWYHWINNIGAAMLIVLIFMGLIYEIKFGEGKLDNLKIIARGI